MKVYLKSLRSYGMFALLKPRAKQFLNKEMKHANPR